MFPRSFAKGASIGANATLVCGITVGEYAMIGAGSVVAKDVPPFALVLGNPGRQKGWVCYCGQRLKRCHARSSGKTVYKCPACERDVVITK